MHEWALAESVIAAVVAAAEKNRISSVTGVVVRVGTLQRVDLEIFSFALDALAKSPDLPKEICGIRLETDENLLRCNPCGHEWSIEVDKNGLREEENEAIHFIPEVAHVYVRCPSCGSPDFFVLKGRGVSIESIEGDC